MFVRIPHWVPFDFHQIADRTEDDEDDHRTEESARISGFLLLPLLLLTAWSGGGLYAIAKAVPYLPQMVWDAIGRDWITPLRVFAAIAVVGYSLYCLVQFVRRKRAAPKLLVGFFAMLIVFSTIIAIWYPQNVLVFTTTLAVLSAVMIGYFLFSDRVKRTFVR